MSDRWDSYDGCVLSGFPEPPAAPQPSMCAYAAQFSDWAQELIARAVQEATHVSIAQAKVMLLDKYFEWRSAVPKSHQNRIGGGHTCLFAVFAEAYRTLKATELTLTPPQLYLPTPPKRVKKVPPPAPIVYAGTILGEVE